MSAFLEKVLEKIQNPILLLLFLLGAVFTLLAVTTELTVPGLGPVKLHEDFRRVSFFLGIGLLLIATLLTYWRESKRYLPDDLKRPLSARRVFVSETQEEILRFVQRQVSGSMNTVAQADIANKFGLSGGETYYRLEHLRLLGFIEKVEMGGRNFYKLSGAYRKEIGLA